MSKKRVVILLIIFLTIIISIFIIFFLFKSEKIVESEDLNFELSKKEFVYGEPLDFEINNLPIEGKISLKYSLIVNGRIILKGIKESYSFEKRVKDSINLPENISEGNYSLRVETIINNKNYLSNFEFKISKPEEEISEVENCTDECGSFGFKQCSENGYKICGNYDNDACLEWGGVTNCSDNQTCSNGICITECISNYKVKCYNEDVYWYDSCGNREEKKEDCDAGKVCYSDSCVMQKILKKLAVVVDFQDRTLEDYSGEGVNSISDFQDILDKMEAHWEWMSVGVEKMSWDIIRITVPHDLSADVNYPYFNGSEWFYFQDEIVNLAKQKVNNELYDYDGDGEIDNIFAIVSSGDKDASNSGYHYIVGGASKNQGVKMFMDPQGSLSIREEVYGNFNHELGHGHTVRDNLWGLPDIYGSYDTLGYLSLMSNSWPLPAVGFSAYDMYLLEWIDPIGISKTTKNILLSPAEENLQAVKVLTDDSKEYFLIEYRKKPKSGFGSASGYADYNGLVIYHVNDYAFWDYANDGFPPLVYVEPADGENEFPSVPEEDDFWSPDNTQSLGVFSAKKWDSDEVIFKVENLRWSGDGILFDVVFE